MTVTELRQIFEVIFYLAAAATILAAIFGPAIIRRSEVDWIAHETIEKAKRRS